MYLVPVAETTQPREQARRSRATDTAELDAAAALVQLTRLVQSIYSRIAVRHDLTPVQAKLLCIVADNPRGMGDLAQCFGVEKAALTGLVDRVERRGLATRSPVLRDRRALQVAPTATGRRQAADFHTEVTTELERLLNPLTPRERDQFRRSMTKLLTASRNIG